VLGFDVETNDWEDRADVAIKGSFGQHGFYNICRPCDLENRLVQLGWAVSDERGNVVVTEHLVLPDGWMVAEKAARYHGTSQAQAEQNGRPLAWVLERFCDEARAVCGRGGRLVSHHLEFDAGILRREMARAGLAFEEEWSGLVRRRGVCTMCPQIGRWLRECFGRDAGPETAMNTLRLKDMATWLLEPEKRSQIEFHTAGADALMHALVYQELRKRAREASGR
jgi:DNA polymerase III epsilon subunit-like protein